MGEHGEHGEYGEHGEHGKDGKHQPDDLKHSIHDSKHYISDSRHSNCQLDDSKQVALALGRHEDVPKMPTEGDIFS